MQHVERQGHEWPIDEPRGAMDWRPHQRRTGQDASYPEQGECALPAPSLLTSHLQTERHPTPQVPWVALSRQPNPGIAAPVIAVSSSSCCGLPGVRVTNTSLPELSEWAGQGPQRGKLQSGQHTHSLDSASPHDNPAS